MHRWEDEVLSRIARRVLKGSFIGLSVFFLHVFQLPEEALQGEHVQMLFLHVPFAFYALALYQSLSCIAFLGLVWRFKIAFLLQTIVIPFCWLWTGTALITGSLWGYPTWGTYWVWDARLTSTFVLFLILSLLMILEHHPSLSGFQKKRLQSWLILMGWIDLPIIHFSVNWWNTLHQRASLSWTGSSSIEATYLYPLLAILTLMGLWLSACIFLVWQKEKVSSRASFLS
jgi:heme exporter protein C